MKITKNILREIVESEMKEATRNRGAVPDQATSRRQQGNAAVDATRAEGQISDADRSLLNDYFAGGRTIIRRGNRGDKVKALQRALLARLEQHHFNDVKDKMGAVDGQFGGGTFDAVEKLQTKYEITVDGVVGRQTWTAIESDGAQSAESSNVRTNSADTATATATQVTPSYKDTDPFGSGTWNDAAKVWYKEDWESASDAAKTGDFKTAIKLKDKDVIYYVKKDGVELTKADIDELEADYLASLPTEANIPYQLGGQSTMVPALEAVNYFNRFTRDLNEIVSMKDDRSFTDIMTTNGEDSGEEDDDGAAIPDAAEAEADAAEASNITVTAEIDETVYSIAPDEANVEFPEGSGIMWTKDDSFAGGSADWALDENIYWSNGKNFGQREGGVKGVSPFSSRKTYSGWEEVEVGVNEDATKYSFRDVLDAGPGIWHNIEDAWFKQNTDSNRFVVPNGTEITVDNYTWKKEEVSSSAQIGREVLSTTWASGSGKWKNGGNARSWASLSNRSAFVEYESAALTVILEESLSYDRFGKLAGIL
jgi:peptidoglycan hydrolase-like protein with peptidoglycan-binding domain